VVRAILAKLSRQGGAGKGETRGADSLARVRLLVMAYTGLAPAEIKRLEPAHVDLVGASVWVPGRRKGAGTRGKRRPLTRQGVAALQAFVTAEAWGPFSTSTMRRAFRLALAKVKREHPTWHLNGVRPYDLRHSFATAVYRITGNLDVTRGLLGHADRKTTLRYAAGAVVDVERRAVARLSRGGL
jgi:integrase